MPTQSPYPPVDIPYVDLWEFLFERTDRDFPDDKVIYRDADTGRSYSYTDVEQTAASFGLGLKDFWGWQKGDVLALFTPNCVDTPAVIWGCHWAGGIVTTANPGYTVDELAFQLRDAGAKALVTQRKFLETAQEAAKKIGIPQDRIILMGDEKDRSMKFKHFRSIYKTVENSKYRRSRLNPKKDLAFLVYSSGTTGHPKGVMISHENIVSNILMGQVVEGGRLSWSGGRDGTGDNILAFVPFFHIYGLTCLVHNGIYSGVTITVMAQFEIERFCSIVENHRISYAYVVPPVILLLGKHPIVRKYDLSSLRMLNSGAAPLSQELVETVHRKINIPIKQAYGLTETSPVTHSQPWETWNTAIGSVGRLLPNQTAKYMSSSDEEVPVGEVGELCIKGPNVFVGYHNNPEATRNALTTDGYFKTGDVGYQDQDGNFYITDRVKELIKYKGFQVAPAELEGLLASSPMVNDVAVIGVYDPSQATELPRAYVVLQPGIESNKKTELEIVQWLQNKVANPKRLRGGVRFIDAVPKSASGKILRRLLKFEAAEEQKGLKAKL